MWCKRDPFHYNCMTWLYANVCVYDLWFCLYLHQLLEAQADYHRRSLAAMEAAIPTIKMQQGEQHNLKTFNALTMKKT